MWVASSNYIHIQDSGFIRKLWGRYSQLGWVGAVDGAPPPSTTLTRPEPCLPWPERSCRAEQERGRGALGQAEMASNG